MYEPVTTAGSVLIPTYLARVEWSKVSTLDTRRYSANYLAASEADRLPWREFRDAVPVLWSGTLADGLDVLVVAKSLTWSDRDVNVYVGAVDPPSLRSYLDLGQAAFVAVFDWHISLAREVSRMLDRDVYVTHGFNPEDTSPDAHSVTAKFHTHVHVPDLAARRPVVATNLSHFDRLTLIEPYSTVLWDVIARWLRGSGASSRWRGRSCFGFVNLTCPLDTRTRDDLHELSRLLDEVHRSYLELVGLFTDGRTERRTGHHRYVPLPAAERKRRLASFVCANSDWLSAESAALLTYLATNLIPARPRDAPRSTRITCSGQVWIAKGMSGAFSLIVSPTRPALHVDFAPRVISTSGATKVISVAPTIIRKDTGEATPSDHARMSAFQHAVATAADRIGRVPSPKRSLPSTSSSPAPPASSA